MVSTTNQWSCFVYLHLSTTEPPVLCVGLISHPSPKLDCESVWVANSFCFAHAVLGVALRAPCTVTVQSVLLVDCMKEVGISCPVHRDSVHIG